jgi:hypothetical protein
MFDILEIILDIFVRFQVLIGLMVGLWLLTSFLIEKLLALYALILVKCRSIAVQLSDLLNSFHPVEVDGTSPRS